MQESIATDQVTGTLTGWLEQQVVVHDEAGSGETVRIVMCDVNTTPMNHQVITLKRVKIRDWPGRDNIIGGILKSAYIAEGCLRLRVAESGIVIELLEGASFSRQAFFEQLDEHGKSQ